MDFRGACALRMEVESVFPISEMSMHSNEALEDSASAKWAHRTCCHNPTRRDLGWKPIFLALTGSDEAVMTLKMRI